jgi:exopolysaccharide production protein ExoZ
MFAASLALPQSIRLWALLALLAGLAAIGLAIPLDGIAAFYTDPIILEFAAGLLIAKAWTSGVTVPVRAALVVTLIGLGLLVAGSEMTLPRIIGAGIPAALIVGGAVFSESRYKRNPSSTLVLLGDASYSIYLSHVIVLPVVAKVWQVAAAA